MREQEMTLDLLEIFIENSDSVTVSFDCESNGLWGRVFSIGMVLHNDIGKTFKIKLLDKNYKEICTDSWVLDNAMPKNIESYVVCDLDDMFAQCYKRIIAIDNTFIWHMGHIVEAGYFRHLYKNGYIEEFEAPYTPVEISTMLMMVGERQDSVDEFIKKHNLKFKSEYRTHDPLYDAEAALLVYQFIKSGKIKK